jgi:hypothetical protein
MKKYKLSEAIAKLEENPKLEFTSDGATLYIDQSAGFGYVEVKFDEVLGLENWNGNIYFDMEWTLIPQPVSFMEVLKSTKAVRVEHKSVTNIPASKLEINTIQRMNNGEYVLLDDLMYYLSYKFEPEELRDILLNGKWYIEED